MRDVEESGGIQVSWRQLDVSPSGSQAGEIEQDETTLDWVAEVENDA